VSALDLITTWPVPSVAAAVVTPAGIAEACGPVDQTFRLASVTKPLAALAILVAVEEEAVTLDDPADDDLLPGATLRHLLSHASGIAPDERKRAAAVASRRIYSNAGIDLAADLVEQATGIAFADYLTDAVTRPLGLTSTTLSGSPAHAASSTVSDLARVVHELLRSSGLLSAALLGELRTAQFPELAGVLPGFGRQTPNAWGLGFEIRGAKSPHWTGSRNSSSTYGHFGQSGTFVWIDPFADVGLVALTDRDFGPWAAEAWPLLADEVLAAFA
jgi:CubicO group peptidase (beta-lactamase class C family)